MIADITRGIQAVVEVIRKKAPDATVMVTGIFPRNDKMAVLPVITDQRESREDGGRPDSAFSQHQRQAG